MEFIYKAVSPHEKDDSSIISQHQLFILQYHQSINMKFSLIAAFCATALAAIVPVEQLERRGGATCGNTFYSAQAVDAANKAACKYVNDDETAGSSSYPHQYKNFEGFEFKGLSGPFYEFPILSSGKVYSGGKYYFFFNRFYVWVLISFYV